MGFEGEFELYDEATVLAEQLESGAKMTRLDLARALLATEIVFASNLVGSGSDWPITTGLDDIRTLELLRRVQKRLTRATRGVLGAGLGTRRPRRH